MEINDFLAITIVGAALSLLIEWITVRFNTNAAGGKAVAIVASIIVGGFYWAFAGTAIWQSILGVLAAASTVYALLINK